MHDASAVRRLERARERNRDDERLFRRQGPGPQTIRERRAFDEFEDQEAHAVDLLDAVDRGDVRMIERREDP